MVWGLILVIKIGIEEICAFSATKKICTISQITVNKTLWTFCDSLNIWQCVKTQMCSSLFLIQHAHNKGKTWLDKNLAWPSSRSLLLPLLQCAGLVQGRTLPGCLRQLLQLFLWLLPTSVLRKLMGCFCLKGLL